MGRYSERYWDNSVPPLAEAAAAIVTAGLTLLMDDHGIGYGCEITDNETGVVGTTHEFKSSKTKAHDAAWEDLMEKQHEYYEIQAEREKELRQKEYIARRAGGSESGGSESDLIGLVIKAAVYIALFVVVVWLVLVAVTLAIINAAVISLIIGLTQKKARRYLFILSLIGAIFVLADYNNGWFTKSLASNASFLVGLIPLFLYLNISAGLVASYFLIRDLFNEKRPPIQTEDEFSKRNLIIMASLLVIGVATVLLQRHFEARRGFEVASIINNSNNTNDANGPTQNVPNSPVSNNAPSNNNLYTNGHFTGAWFTVTVPADFTARPSMQSRSGSGYESAFFDSPEGDVEFYIFSPQWGGDPTDNNIDNNIEKITSTYHETSKGLIKKWTEIQALDGSYFRAYQDTKVQNGTIHWIIGLKYKSKAAYAKYKPAYLSFKKSLKQFSD
jgi:hypothetical protein